MSELRKKSIAVLLLSPFGRTFDDSVFADGIHDDILTQLSKISGLRVIARTSMVLYRDSKKTLHQIGNGLDVGYLLEGSTRRSGGKTRITAQLIRTADEGHIWAETYDRNDADVLAGDTDAALNLLEHLIRQPGFLAVWRLRLDPVYNPLRSNPRFQALEAKSR